MFPSKYQILLAGMNPVSDVRLSIACFNAGMTPILCGFIYYRNGLLNHTLFEQGLLEYVETTGSCNIIPSLDGNDILNPKTIEILCRYKIKFVELIEGINETSWPIIKKVCDENHIAPIIKILHYNEILSGFTLVMLKGNAGAGRGTADNLSLDDLIDHIQAVYPLISIIVSGGVGTGVDIEHFLSRGACAVAIGTVFAASSESCISNNAKQRMLAATFTDSIKLGDGNQNALIFSNIENDDYNNTKSIRMGIKTGEQGHIFIGKAIDHVNSIEPVIVILEKLLKGTRYEKNDNSILDDNAPSSQLCMGT
jgi:hypothetical protein